MRAAFSLSGVLLALSAIASASNIATPGLAQVFDQKPIAVDAIKKKSHRTNDLVALHKNLTDIESISNNEGHIGKWLEASLESQGYTVELQEVTKGRYNVLAWPGDKRNTRLLITSHIDTVPPYIPYKAHTNDSGTYISGRGSVDAKASVAAMIIAANSLLDSVEVTPNDLSLLFVVGEEINGDGMRAAASGLDLAPKRIIFGEPTEHKLASGHKGIMQFSLRAFGKAAHSGYPWLGRSATQILVRALDAVLDLEQTLPSSDRYGVTTINVGTVSGGVARNVVAESAQAEVAIRIAAGTPADIQSAVEKAISKAVADLGGDDVVELEFLGRGYGPVPIDTDVPGFESMSVNYGTDIPNFNVTVEGQKRYLYGPGSILVAHSDHEALTLESLERAVKDYKKLILHCLQT